MESLATAPVRLSLPPQCRRHFHVPRKRAARPQKNSTRRVVCAGQLRLSQRQATKLLSRRICPPHTVTCRECVWQNRTASRRAAVSIYNFTNGWDDFATLFRLTTVSGRCDVFAFDFILVMQRRAPNSAFRYDHRLSTPPRRENSGAPHFEARCRSSRRTPFGLVFVMHGPRGDFAVNPRARRLRNEFNFHHRASV